MEIIEKSGFKVYNQLFIDEDNAKYFNTVCNTIKNYIFKICFCSRYATKVKISGEIQERIIGNTNDILNHIIFLLSDQLFKDFSTNPKVEISIIEHYFSDLLDKEKIIIKMVDYRENDSSIRFDNDDIKPTTIYSIYGINFNTIEEARSFRSLCSGVRCRVLQDIKHNPYINCSVNELCNELWLEMDHTEDFHGNIDDILENIMWYLSKRIYENKNELMRDINSRRMNYIIRKFSFTKL